MCCGETRGNYVAVPFLSVFFAGSVHVGGRMKGEVVKGERERQLNPGSKEIEREKTLKGKKKRTT